VGGVQSGSGHRALRQLPSAAAWLHQRQLTSALALNLDQKLWSPLVRWSFAAARRARAGSVARWCPSTPPNPNTVESFRKLDLRLGLKRFDLSLAPCNWLSNSAARWGGINSGFRLGHPCAGWSCRLDPLTANRADR